MFLNDWNNAKEVYEEFEGAYLGKKELYEIKEKEDIEILLASYTQENWEGDAFVLFRLISTGELFEVNGAHCSCYGLEGQWNPENTTIGELMFRLENGRLGLDGYYGNDNRFATELRSVLQSLLNEKQS